MKNKGKKVPQGKKKRRNARLGLSESRMPYGAGLTHEEFDRTLRKVSRRLPEKQKGDDKP